MDSDTVKLIRIPADTWRAVVEALEGRGPLFRQGAMWVGGRIRENALPNLDIKATPEDFDTWQEWVCAANKAASDVDAALELARKVSAE